MKSMTGYGRGEAVRDGFKIIVELSSVNRRQGDLVIHAPRELEPLEPRVRDAINRRVARGRLTARIAVQSAGDPRPDRVRLDLPLAQAYATELAALARTLHLAGGVTLDSLLRLPGVVLAPEGSLDPDALAPVVDQALEAALVALVRMREKEGRHLARDLRTRIGTMTRLAARIGKRAPLSRRDYQEALLARIRAAGLADLTADDERLRKEVVFFADRSDITEELTRLDSHFRQFADCLGTAEPVGRTLDFLAQEMGREINTIGSKADDAAISEAVVLLKAELEKFREQAQNVE